MIKLNKITELELEKFLQYENCTILKNKNPHGKDLKYYAFIGWLLEHRNLIDTTETFRNN